MEKISRLFCEGEIKAGDHFIYTDAWNPTIVQLKYMSQLLNIPIMIHGFWHAGNYDKNDFLGRLINSQWVKTFEKSLAQAIDYNWFASDYHLNMFRKNFGYKEIELVKSCIGVSGYLALFRLSGVDKLLCFMIIKIINRMIKQMNLMDS